MFEEKRALIENNFISFPCINVLIIHVWILIIYEYSCQGDTEDQLD